MPLASRTTRRRFLSNSAAALLAQGVWTARSRAAARSSLEKLQLAAIGVANRGGENLQGVASEEIVAICDIDANYLAEARRKHPAAKSYADYRELLAAEAGRLDGVVISTPDHHHAPAAMRAIQAGLHVYCEKPLTHTVEEARLIAEAARRRGVVTQLGTQIHAGDNYRRTVELVRSGVLGPIREVHVRVGSQWSGVGLDCPSAPPPAEIDWDLWLGPAPPRDFSPGKYHPFHWRRWWDFGGGSLADMGCHYIDLVFWALDLLHPTRCAATGAAPDPNGCPTGLTVEYDFPARGPRGPVRLVWYDGQHAPPPEIAAVLASNGVLFVGEEGQVLADYSQHRLLPEDKFRGFVPPPAVLAASRGHHAEWIEACKHGGQPTCHFDYAGPLTETVLLGNVAFRAGQPLAWDADALRATNCPAADALLRKQYRPGWEVRL
jgi:predicted dehydrogenase